MTIEMLKSAHMQENMWMNLAGIDAGYPSPNPTPVTVVSSSHRAF
jgi:hypothetical protein